MPRAVDFHEEKATLSQYQNKKNTIIISFIEKAIKTREVSYTKNCYSFVVTAIKLLLLLKIIKTLRAITEKAIMPRAVDFHEEKARKTSFLTTLYPLSQYQNKKKLSFIFHRKGDNAESG